jgi:LysM repeat protein
MKSRLVRSLLAIAALLAGTAGFWPAATVTAAPLAQANLLVNGNMESFAGNGVASNWDPWWETIANPGNGNLNYAYQPTWIQESNHVFVESGSLSQHIGHSWDPWHAGIRQTISVAPGSVVHITAYGRVFASTPDFPAPSDTAVNARMQIGAEPNGSIDWASGTVKWGGQASPHDTWGQFNLDVTAGAAGKVTIFLSANFIGDSRYHLDTWWDNVSAAVTGTGPGPAPTSSGGGGNPPPATNPPPAATAFKIPTPDASGNVVYVVQAGDTLYRIAGITGISVDQIRALNGLTSDILSIGQRLIIVQGAAAAATATTAPAATAAATSGSDATAAVTEAGATETATSAAQGSTPNAPGGTAVAQVTAAATPGTGTVCALLWNDKNGDGIRDATEALLPGGQIAVVEIATGKPIQAYTTDGVSEPHCFKDLPAGQYTVSFAAPSGYNATTVTSTPLDVETGVTKALEFGAQPSAAIANQPAARPSNSALLTALLFAGGVVFLLLAAGVAAFLFLRRPS